MIQYSETSTTWQQLRTHDGQWEKYTWQVRFRKTALIKALTSPPEVNSNNN